MGQGEHKELGGVMARTADPNQSRDIPDLMASPSVYEVGGGEGGKKKEICVWEKQSDGICVPKSHLWVMEPWFSGNG